jgi:NAD(P)-dependent dehydrogenase (short-subunit alcohol dehydrogenase family)
MSNFEKWFGLSGRNVFLTGAAGQLGTALAQGFNDVGAVVYGFDLNETREPVLFAGFATGNIGDRDEVAAAFASLLPESEDLAVLVNNAGISMPADFLGRTADEFSRVHDVNVMGSLYCTQEFLRRHEARTVDGAAIVNIGSIYGVLGPDMRIYTDYGVATPEVYGMTKAALLQMTRYLAATHGGKGVRVNAVSPGGIYNRSNPQGEGFVTEYSGRVPLGRMAQVEEIVAAVLYLAGPGASYVTGQNLMVDGGLTVW